MHRVLTIILCVITISCGQAPDSSPSSSAVTPQAEFEITDISTGWNLTGDGAWAMYVPTITFSVRNTGSTDMQGIKLGARFYTTDGDIMGRDSELRVGQVSAGETRGSFSIRCTNGYTINDGSWDRHLEYMHGHRQSPHRVIIGAEPTGGVAVLAGEYDIYIP